MIFFIHFDLRSDNRGHYDKHIHKLIEMKTECRHWEESGGVPVTNTHTQAVKKQEFCHLFLHMLPRLFEVVCSGDRWINTREGLFKERGKSLEWLSSVDSPWEMLSVHVRLCCPWRVCYIFGWKGGWTSLTHCIPGRAEKITNVPTWWWTNYTLAVNSSALPQ